MLIAFELSNSELDILDVSTHRNTQKRGISKNLKKGNDVTIAKVRYVLVHHDLNNLESIFFLYSFENMLVLQNKSAYWYVKISKMMIEIIGTSNNFCIFLVDINDKGG